MTKSTSTSRRAGRPAQMTLVIGNRNYSSWSLRPWLFMRYHQIPFNELRISLGRTDTAERLQAFSPSAQVPVLLDGDLTLWDSLAICEYVSEHYTQGLGWPAAAQARAVARSACSEVHSGFACLRHHLPMNLRGAFQWRHVSDAVDADIERIVTLWRYCHSRFAPGGPWLFGEFCIADAFFAPVATRFRTYAVPLPPDAATYVDRLLGLPAVEAWYAAACAEPENLPQFEALETWLLRQHWANPAED